MIECDISPRIRKWNIAIICNKDIQAKYMHRLGKQTLSSVKRFVFIFLYYSFSFVFFSNAWVLIGNIQPFLIKKGDIRRHCNRGQRIKSFFSLLKKKIKAKNEKTWYYANQFAICKHCWRQCHPKWLGYLLRKEDVRIETTYTQLLFFFYCLYVYRQMSGKVMIQRWVDMTTTSV